MQTIRVLRYITRNRPFISASSQRFASKKVTYPKITLSDLPTTEGDYYTQNNAVQRAYTMQLVVGVGAFAFSLAFGFAANMFESHTDIPEMPEAIECYKDL